jgi:hypothetical protein
VEVQVAKAEYVLNLISVHFTEVLSEWVKEVDKVSACDDQCEKILADHAVTDLYNREYNVK